MKDLMILKIVFPSVFALVGIIFICHGIEIQRSLKKQKKRCTCKTKGKITKMWDSLSLNSSDTFTRYGELQYVVGDKIIKKTEALSGSGLREGQDVEVYYNPRKRNDYYIVENKSTTKCFLSFSIMGVIFMTVAVASAIMLFSLK